MPCCTFPVVHYLILFAQSVHFLFHNGLFFTLLYTVYYIPHCLIRYAMSHSVLYTFSILNCQILYSVLYILCLILTHSVHRAAHFIFKHCPIVYAKHFMLHFDPFSPLCCTIYILHHPILYGVQYISYSTLAHSVHCAVQIIFLITSFFTLGFKSQIPHHLLLYDSWFIYISNCLILYSVLYIPCSTQHHSLCCAIHLTFHSKHWLYPSPMAGHQKFPLLRWCQ